MTNRQLKSGKVMNENRNRNMIESTNRSLNGRMYYGVGKWSEKIKIYIL